MQERVVDIGGGFELARKKCMDRERWSLCRRHPLRDVPGGTKAS